MHKLAKKLLIFLKQKEDFETAKILKTFCHDSKPKATRVKTESHAMMAKPISAKLPKAPEIQVHEQATSSPKPAPQPSASIFTKLKDKVKKACPELRIKELVEIKKGGIPDCDVILLTDTQVAEVYQSLAKAIDKQLALTETVLLDSQFMGDLLTKSYKLVLVSPHARNSSSFMQHVKMTGKKQTFIGSSPLIFLEEPSVLSTNIQKKQELWQTIKTHLS